MQAGPWDKHPRGRRTLENSTILPGFLHHHQGAPPCSLLVTVSMKSELEPLMSHNRNSYGKHHSTYALPSTILYTQYMLQCWFLKTAHEIGSIPALLLKKKKNNLFYIGVSLIKDRRQKEAAEDEMLGWHCQLNGHESEQSPRDSEGQGRLVCCSPWDHKELDTQLSNWTTTRPG